MPECCCEAYPDRGIVQVSGSVMMCLDHGYIAATGLLQRKGPATTAKDPLTQAAP